MGRIVNRRFWSILGLFLVFFMQFSSGVAGALQSSGEASPIPWSGYWWPHKYGGLSTGYDYRGHPAPLEKYLLLTTGSSSGDAVAWYEDHYYIKDAESWWGLCPAYARAAVKESYPILPSSHDNIVFRVGDKKGLLTACHDDRSGIIYASGDTPVHFHRWLLDYIGDQKTAFTADMDDGREVWYHPIYRYEMTSTRSSRKEHVTVKVYYADDSVPPDYMGTKEKNAEYTYDLFLDEDGAITGGEWTGGSASYHPDKLAYPETTGSQNPYLDCEKIRQIARTQDDFLERPYNQASRLLPGTYHLVLHNEDRYSVEGAAGDAMYLTFTRQEGSSRDMEMQVADANGNPVWTHTLDAAQSSASFHMEMENPPYTVLVSQADYSDPNIYSLTMDCRGANAARVPYIPKGGSWSGFALTNAAGEPARDVMLVTADSAGGAMHTVLGPLDLEPHEKRLFHFADLPVRAHEYQDTEFLRLSSDQPVAMVNLFAAGEGPMGCFAHNGAAGRHMVLADIYDGSPWNPRYMKGAVTNESFAQIGATFHVFSAAGDLISTFDQSLAPGGRMEVRPGSSPFFNVPDGGWVEIVADPGAKLSGYQYINNTAGQADTLETGFALPVSEGPKIVPHVTQSAGAWETSVTLINPNPEANPVIIHPARKGEDSAADMRVSLGPFEKRTLDISAAFGEVVQEGGQRSILEISGAYPVAGHFRYAASGGDTVAYPLLGERSWKKELILPHSARSRGGWYTGVGVCNPNEYPVTVFARPYSDKGEAMNSRGVFIDLEPGAYEVFTVQDRFGGDASGISYVELLAEDPEDAEIAGFYLYSNSGGAGKSRKLVGGAGM